MWCKLMLSYIKLYCYKLEVEFILCCWFCLFIYSFVLWCCMFFYCIIFIMFFFIIFVKVKNTWCEVRFYMVNDWHMVLPFFYLFYIVEPMLQINYFMMNIHSCDVYFYFGQCIEQYHTQHGLFKFNILYANNLSLNYIFFAYTNCSRTFSFKVFKSINYF